MELRNLSKNTQRYYLSAVIGLARYYQQSPDKLTQEMIEDYLLYLKNDKGNTPGVPLWWPACYSKMVEKKEP